MGRSSYSIRQEADTLKRISVYWLRRNGYFRNSFTSGGIKWVNQWTAKETSVGLNSSISAEDSYIQLYYVQTNNDGNKKDFDYKVQLSTTSCFFGGKRYWFTCPLTTDGKICGKRVAVLYKAGDYFGCRHCYNLTYSLRNDSKMLKIGGNVSYPELDDLSRQIKKRFYKGKITRKYLTYLKKAEKLRLAMTTFAKYVKRKKRSKQN